MSFCAALRMRTRGISVTLYRCSRETTRFSMSSHLIIGSASLVSMAYISCRNIPPVDMRSSRHSIRIPVWKWRGSMPVMCDGLGMHT